MYFCIFFCIFLYFFVFFVFLFCFFVLYIFIGSLIGKLPERHGISLNLETLIADTECFFYFLPLSSILFLETNYPYIATGLYNWYISIIMF